MSTGNTVSARGLETSATGDEFARIEGWIDEHVNGLESLGLVIGQLTEWTLPSDLAEPGEYVNPLRGDLDAQFWFWNRAANRYLERELTLAAVDVWSAHYLNCLSLQLQYHQRFHKGMPLCNIGFAFARAGRGRLAVRAWLLGLIEDALTDLGTVGQTQNYRNLLSASAAPAVLRQLIVTIESRFIDQSITPSFPETAIDLWLHPSENPAATSFSKVCLDHVDIVSKRLVQSFPRLPEAAQPWKAILAPFWGFADWQLERVLNTQ